MSWPMVKLGDVAPAIPVKNVNLDEDELVWQLNLDQVESNTGRVIDKIKQPLLNAGSSTYFFNNEHVLYSKLRPYLNKVVLPDELGIATTELVPMKPNQKRLNKKYLAYYLRSKPFVEWISTQVSGAKMPRVVMSVFWQHEMPLPPLDEQKRIAAILDKADSIRQKREQAIKLADDFLRAMFVNMFFQLEHQKNKIKLGDIVTLDAPMVDPREEKYIDLIHIGPDRIEKNTGLLLPALTAREENLISKKFLFDENYVLYSKIRPYLKKCAIPDFSGLCSADMYPVKPISGKTNREFIWQLLLSDFFTKYTETLPDRASIPKLNKKELLNFELSLPPIALQDRYKLTAQKVNYAKLKMRKQNIYNVFNRIKSELLTTKA